MYIEAYYTKEISRRVEYTAFPEDFLQCNSKKEVLDLLHDNMIDYGEFSSPTYDHETEFEYSNDIDDFLEQWEKLKNTNET